MSLLPFLLDMGDELDSWPYPRRSNNFGCGILPADILASTPRCFRQTRYFPVSSSRGGSRACAEQFQVGKDGFQVCMDVQGFAPNEISVKTVDNCVIVEGNHGEKVDEHGYISRQFKRRYVIPKGYDPKDVVSTLSSDGVLAVKAPPEAKSLEKGNERVVQIQQTGPAHLNVGNTKDEAPVSTEDKKAE